MPSFKVNHHTLKIITLVYKRWESRNECRYFRRSDVAKQFLNRIDEDTLDKLGFISLSL